MPDSLGEKLQSSLGSAYTITRELGGGGMARVFVADEEALGRKVVVKVVAPELAEGMSAERFAREVKLAARLGISAETAIAIEDSPAGTQAALAAGMHVVVVPDLVAPPDDIAPRLAAVFPSLDALREAVTPVWTPTPAAQRARSHG